MLALDLALVLCCWSSIAQPLNGLKLKPNIPIQFGRNEKGRA